MVTKLILNENEYAQVVEAMENSLIEDGWEDEYFDDLLLSCAKAIDTALAAMDIELVLAEEVEEEDEPEEVEEEEEEEVETSDGIQVYEVNGKRCISIDDAVTLLDMITIAVQSDENITTTEEYYNAMEYCFTRFCREHNIDAIDYGEEYEEEDE